jgi:hypothetical protein
MLLSHSTSQTSHGLFTHSIYLDDVAAVAVQTKGSDPNSALSYPIRRDDQGSAQSRGVEHVIACVQRIVSGSWELSQRSDRDGLA